MLSIFNRRSARKLTTDSRDKNLLVSIITPSYNQGEYIEDTLSSINYQSYSSIEHIVVDGKSDDNTVNVLKSWDDKIRYVSEEDNGQSDAVNKGIRMSKGEIIGWLNSDDVYTDDSVVESVVKFFARNPDAEVLYGRGDFVDKNKSFIREAYIHKDDNNLLFSFAWAVGILQPAVFFRRAVFEKAGFLDEANHTSMDYELWVRLTHLGIKMHFLNQKLALARYYEDMKSASNRGKQLEDVMNIVLKYYKFIHPRWINVYANYKVTNDVQIVTPDGGLGTTRDDSERIEELQKELFCKHNTSKEAITAILNPKHCDPAVAKQSLNKYFPEWKEIIRNK